MAITEATGFPVNATPTAAPWQVSITTAAIGDLVLVTGRMNTSAVTVTGVSGGGVTTWAKAGELVDTTNGRYIYLWWGIATSATTANVVLTLSGTPVNVEIFVDSFHEASNTAWVIDNAQESQVEQDSTTTPTWPSLTPSESLSMYFGYSLAANNESAFSAGYTNHASANGNQLVFKLGLAAGVSEHPSCTQTLGFADQIAAIFTPALSVPAAAPRQGFLPRNVLGRGVRNRGQIAAFLARVPKVATAVVAADLGTLTAQAVTAATALVTAATFPTPPDPTATATTSASALLTAPTFFTATAAAITTATAATTAASKLTPTAQAVTSATAAITAVSKLAPTAQAATAATAALTAVSLLTPSAQAATSATCLVTAGSDLGSPTASAVTSATAALTAVSLLVASAQAATAATCDVTVPGASGPPPQRPLTGVGL